MQYRWSIQIVSQCKMASLLEDGFDCTGAGVGWFFIQQRSIGLQYMSDLSGKIDAVEGKVNELYKKMEACEAEAKGYLAKSQQTKGSTKEMYKQKALMALKKKKQLMQQANKYNSHQNMLQQAVFSKETAEGHKQMYGALKGAVEEQKAAMKDIDIDKMDDLHDEMLDLKLQSDMMNEMLNRDYDLDVDEDQFEEDFMEFEREVAREKKKEIVKPKPQPQHQNNMDIDSFLK